MPLIFRIALWACFFTVIYLFTTRMVSCKSETAQALDSVEEIAESTEDVIKSVEENVKEVTDELFEDSDEIIYTNEEHDEDDSLADDLFPEADTEEVVKPAPVRKRTPDPKPTQVRSDASGKYLVVAGNYLVESNAREMVKKLNRMGFPNAEHLVFDQSQYYTVVASRSSSRSGAQSSSSTLKAKGIDCYVHTQRD